VRHAPRCGQRAASCTNRHPSRQVRGPADIFSGPLHGCLFSTPVKFSRALPGVPGQPETDGGLLADSEGRKIAEPADERIQCLRQRWRLPAETVGYQYNKLGMLTGFGTSSSYY
jgi:hypothetical protein